MDIYNADLHIHSPHSIAVSKSLNLDTMLETSRKKGLNILGTGDILQPEWLKYMESNLEREKNGLYTYKDTSYILQTEIEDGETIHQLIFFPDFDSVKEIQNKLKPYSKNILNNYGGRPRINLSPAELTETVTDSGGVIGPAHAFTPFRAIFRQGKFENLEDCYQGALKKVHFIELGLSANTELADRLESLKKITFLSNSDAHSQEPSSLGREFNRFNIDEPSFEEILSALERKDGRSITLNVGLHPKLGKYYNMFCGKCRRRILFKEAKKQIDVDFSQYSVTENFVIFYANNPEESKKKYIKDVSNKKMICPACKESLGKNQKIKLGVSERIDTISTYDEPKHPDHRPPYINAIPLLEIIRAIKGIKSKNSKTVVGLYNNIIEKLGKEFDVLLDIPLDEIKKYNEDVGNVIEAFRKNDIKYNPGGGGTFGSIKF
ncbi:MAG: phosphotransferase [Candidatus Lokiarchaeota archaeon]|nr:phosphotransferase [Candidatus Lokiarchaeota archaeon]